MVAPGGLSLQNVPSLGPHLCAQPRGLFLQCESVSRPELHGASVTLPHQCLLSVFLCVPNPALLSRCYQKEGEGVRTTPPPWPTTVGSAQSAGCCVSSAWISGITIADLGSGRRSEACSLV